MKVNNHYALHGGKINGQSNLNTATCKPSRNAEMEKKTGSRPSMPGVL